jgi:hypothetical protein
MTATKTRTRTKIMGTRGGGRWVFVRGDDAGMGGFLSPPGDDPDHSPRLDLIADPPPWGNA